MLPSPVRSLSWSAGNNPAAAAKPLKIGRFPGPPRCRSARAVAALALLFAAACGDGPAPVPEAQPYADAGMAEAGPYRMHYALTMTRDLPSAIAGSYGIVQRRNLALLTITLASRDAHAEATIDAAEIEATRVALTGERQAVHLARHDETGGPTWLATIEIRHRVPVTIEIRARATPASPEIRARLTREFRLE
jgi:Domain of unknown function (DUF4426)